MTQNLTPSLDEEALKRARVAAARRGLSLSGLLREQLTCLGDQDDHDRAPISRSTCLRRARPPGIPACVASSSGSVASSIRSACGPTSSESRSIEERGAPRGRPAPAAGAKRNRPPCREDMGADSLDRQTARAAPLGPSPCTVGDSVVACPQSVRRSDQRRDHVLSSLVGVEPANGNRPASTVQRSPQPARPAPGS